MCYQILTFRRTVLVYTFQNLGISLFKIFTYFTTQLSQKTCLVLVLPVPVGIFMTVHLQFSKTEN